MKAKQLFPILLAALVLLFGCEDSKESSSLEVSQSSFNAVGSAGETLKVDITCDDTWTASSNEESWCTVAPQSGKESQTITIQVMPNYEETARTAIVTVGSNGIKKEINITQEASETSVDPASYHYNLPVIFHVLYKNKSDNLQYVSADRLSEILAIVNKLYQDKSKSVDMNLTFTLATTNPEGEKLSTPGVEYTLWPDSYPINCDEFMNDNSQGGGKGYVKYIWDPNRYINVMMYNFEPDADSDGSVTLGISHLPFSTTGSNYLPGLNETKQSYMTVENLAFPYCASINSDFIEHQSNSTEYDPADVTVTLAHELGHYLGLHHVFTEAKDGSISDSCEDTDYCKDTPSYNKVLYDNDYQYIRQNEPENYTFAYLVKRTNCADISFTSRNIMDYSISYSDQFSEDQLARVRHVLMYSPLIPGPKAGQASTRAAYNRPLDLPIRVVR
ncbi:MAG: zinc-dependent metalloproteinase lipoprotein [Bacteroides sp.]|nr:zinc-dependent metalloproteinase lipoprotein [Bacteroides sp.]